MEEEVEIQINIPKLLYEKLVKMSEYIGFVDIKEFIIYVLEQLVETSDFEGEVMSKEDEKS